MLEKPTSRTKETEPDFSREMSEESPGRMYIHTVNLKPQQDAIAILNQLNLATLHPCLKNAKLVLDTISRFAQEETPFQQQIDLLSEHIENHMFVSTTQIPDEILQQLHIKFEETFNEELIPYFMLYETSLEMHNKTLGKIAYIKER
jgi:hypothetical protein